MFYTEKMSEGKRYLKVLGCGGSGGDAPIIIGSKETGVGGRAE